MLADQDFDGEGPAVADDDDDNDGYPDLEDDFPLDPTDWLDTDGDTVGDLSDTDDDNDGLPDTDESSIGTDPTLVDSDNDGICDGPYQRDSCSQGPDPYPTDPSLPRDTDGDGLWDDLPEDAADIFIEDQDDDGDGLDDEVETGTDSTSPPQIVALIHSTPIRMETDSAMAAIRSLASAQGERTQSPSIQTSQWIGITISWLIKLILHGKPSMGTRMQMTTAMVTLTAWSTNVTHPH